MQWYYPPTLGADLSKGFDRFDKHDNSKDEHIDSLLKTIMAHEEEEGKKIDAHVVTWRGMMTKVRLAATSYILARETYLILIDHVGALR